MTSAAESKPAFPEAAGKISYETPNLPGICRNKYASNSNFCVAKIHFHIFLTSLLNEAGANPRPPFPRNPDGREESNEKRKGAVDNCPRKIPSVILSLQRGRTERETESRKIELFNRGECEGNLSFHAARARESIDHFEDLFALGAGDPAGHNVNSR